MQDINAIDGTRTVGSGLTDGELPSPFPVVYVTTISEGGIAMARKADPGEDGQGIAEGEEGVVSSEDVPDEGVEDIEPEEPEEEDEGVEPEEEGEEPEDTIADEEEGEEEGEEERPGKSKRPYVFTPYQAASYLNELLKAAGVKNAKGTGPKKVGSPMMYIYARNNRFEVRRSPLDIERQKKGLMPKDQDPRWEVYPLESFKAWAAEYVANQKAGITAAQARAQKKEQEGAVGSADGDQAERDVAAALKESLAALEGGSDEVTEAEDEKELVETE